MKNITHSVCMIVVLIAVWVTLSFSADAKDGGYSLRMKAKIKAMQKELQKFTEERVTVQKRGSQHPCVP